MIFGFIWILVGLIGFFLNLGPFDGTALLIVFGVIGALFILAIWHREYYHRPIAVEVRANGIVMDFRYSSKREYTWREIAGICLANERDSVFNFFIGGFGAIILWKGELYATTYEISDAIRLKYREKEGKEIPQIMPNEREQDFRARARRERTL